MNNAKKYYVAKKLKTEFPAIILAILGFLAIIIVFLMFSFDASISILEKAPNSNFALLLNTFHNFWFDSLFFSFGLAGVAYVIAGIYFALTNYKYEHISSKEYILKILLTFVLVTFISFIFVIIMAATKPENSSIIFSLFSYIGSIIIFMYNVFFKDKKVKSKEEDKT